MSIYSIFINSTFNGRFHLIKSFSLRVTNWLLSISCIINFI
nr:MAG TPA: hypothetical protein [Caudoviricetes sp.]